MNVSITDSFNRRGNRAAVYEMASTRQAYYTTPEKTDSIRYESSTLVIRLAFESKALARGFYDDLDTLNNPEGERVVGDMSIEMCSKMLDDSDMVFRYHYQSTDYDSPMGSRESVASSVQFLPILNPIVQYQSFQPLVYAHGGGFQMCHIKSKRFCTKKERSDPNNFFACTPSFHKMFDGQTHGTPTVMVKVASVSAEPTSLVVESGTQTRYRVELEIDFRDELAFLGLEGEFKDGTWSSDDRLTHKTWVYVLDTSLFKKYMKWKVKDTQNKWCVDNGGGDGSGSEVGDEEN